MGQCRHPRLSRPPTRHIRHDPALRNVIRLRNSEDALDSDILRMLVVEGVLSKPKPPDGIPPRGSAEKAVCDLIEGDVVHLITTRSELWELVARERLWRRDFLGAIDAAEKGWRAAVGGGPSGASLGSPVDARDDKRTGWPTGMRGASWWRGRTSSCPCSRTTAQKWRRAEQMEGKGEECAAQRDGQGRDSWEGSDEWRVLEALLEGLL